MDPASQYGNTPLHFAAYWGKTDVAKLLLEAGADTTVKNNFGNAPLQRAASMGEVENVHVLIKAGADVTDKDYDGNTALHWAAKTGSLETLRALLKHAETTLENKAVREMLNAKNNMGQTPLQLAKNDAITDLLRKAGART